MKNEIKDGKILVDGEAFRILSGEIHWCRQHVFRLAVAWLYAIPSWLASYERASHRRTRRPLYEKHVPDGQRYNTFVCFFLVCRSMVLLDMITRMDTLVYFEEMFAFDPLPGRWRQAVIPLKLLKRQKELPAFSLAKGDSEKNWIGIRHIFFEYEKQT